ncbi:EH signature domain-containing protein [Rhodobacter capsulatus]|uniref:EH_Signature domain-containing protein n=1 Tax=Rhodobacter capsulatus TaxID=1061 RepID=A0A1G7PLB4_RHOCA|nr:EH signature domain-containing protein [Rhodobacter capsulatus]SDF87135.1 EH_Signature domain-containing protein [Rhodobacter capsulatus]
MRLDDAITRLTRFSPPAVPELRYIETAVQRVHERWPDVAVNVNPREREALAVRLRDRVAKDDWENARISFVLAAASAVFDPERRDRADLAQARSFLIEELRASRSETFLSGLIAVYLESYVANGAHTRSVASAIDAARGRMSPSVRGLLKEVPELLDAADGPRLLASRMVRMTDPFLELSRAGLRNPHGPGFMERVHEVLSALVAPELTGRTRIDWYIDWIRPPGREARTIGAERAIEALTGPWINTAPSDLLRSHLVEALIEMYGDPRIRSGGVWAGVGRAHMEVIHRWLTREDMRFFTGVVDAAQKDAMWPPRRDFWLKLFDEKRIDAAWVAFSSQAADYARAHLMREDARNADSRFGFQRARQNTSLLIMKIGNKIMVDGCHSYKTHVFDQDDPMAPKLFQEGYDCDEIMRASPESKPHNSIDSWQRWVRDMINADVGRSHRKNPYTKVYRPRAPAARYTPPPRPYAPPPRRDPPVQPQFDLGARAPAGPAPHPAGPAAVPPRIIITSPPRSPAAGTAAPPDRARTTLDLLLKSGAPAARAIIDYFDRLGDGKTKTLLSPNARAGLEWIIRSNGPPPDNLRNALTHLLSSMETFGHGPAGIMARSVETPVPEVTSPAPLPPLPDTSMQRLELLFRHAEVMEAFARERYVFSGDRTLGTALAKLKSRNPDLRPAEIHHLQQLYELMRRDAARGRK